MSGQIRRGSVATALAIAVCLPVLSDTVAAQLATPEFKCQNTVAKQGRKLFRKTFKNLAKCQDKISKGDLPDTTDCATELNTAAKIADTEANYQQKLTLYCPDGVVANLVFGGSCTGVTTQAALATCSIAEHESAAQELVSLVYPRNVCASGYRYGGSCVVNADCPSGSNVNVGTCVPANQGLDSDQRRCQKLLGKTVSKEAAKRMGTIQKCKKKVSKGKLPASTDCVAASQVKLDDLLAGSREKIALACPVGLGAPLAVAGSCAGQTETTSVQSCSLCRSDRNADDLIAVQYGNNPFGVQATAKQITDTADCVGGPMSRCRVNDYLLSNDKIRVVIQDIQRSLMGIGQFGGQIIDGDLVRSSGPDRDSFEEWSVSLNIEGTAHYTSLTVINDGSDGGPAIIRAIGVDDLLDFLNPSAVVAGFGLVFPASANDVDLPLAVSTDYILEPGKNYVRVETTVENLGGSQVQLFFGDFLNGSGEVEIFQPGYGFGEPLVTVNCTVPISPNPPDTPCLRNESMRNFVAYGGHDSGDGVAYGYLHEFPRTTTFSTSGVTVPQLGVEIVAALLGLAPRPLSIAPGDSSTVTRYFAIGENVSSITDIDADIQCKPTGRISGTVTAGGNPVENADVSILGALNAAPDALTFNAVTHTYTDASGNYSLTLPPGSYNVVANLDGYPYEGGGAAPLQHAVNVVATQTVTQNIALPATGGLQVTVTDENGDDSPAKVSVVGFDSSPEPANIQNIAFAVNRTGLFGDFEDERPFGVARVKFVDPSGDSGVIAIEPGSYQVVTSRGMEYSISKQNVTVAASPAPVQMVAAQVEHVIDSDGFISADFHVHSIDSPDSEVPRTLRVLSLIGEGMNFFTPSDHDIRVDFAPTIAAVGASSILGSVINSEITTFDYGHFNAWPMDIDPAQVNGGSVDHGGAAPDGADFPSAGNYSLSPAEIIAAAHADPGVDTVQINHFYSHFGLDGGSGLGIDTGLVPPQSSVPAAAHRLDPGILNYFSNVPAAPADEKFDALELWIGDNRDQIYNNFLGSINASNKRGGSLGDWFNMINQGILSTGVADSDSHNTLSNVIGFPRTMVASPSDDPEDLNGLGETLSANVNAGHAFGTNGPMVRVEVSAASTGQVGSLEEGASTLIVTTNGEVEVEVEIQSPEWAEFDTVEYYVNTTTKQRTISGLQSGAGVVSIKRYGVTPDYVHPVTPSLQPAPGTLSNRWEATDSLNLTGLTGDIWVVVLVRGTDTVSAPLFPVLPNDLKQSTNTTLSDLTDSNVGENGITTMAFTNPLFVDVDGGGWTAPGVSFVTW
jgi:hypothetical protein